jgi:hypothetical protein
MADADRWGVLERLRGTARDLVSLTGAEHDVHLRHKRSRDEWSAAEVLAHLADAELVYATRLRLIVAQDRPQLVWYDEQGWVERFGALDADPRDTLVRWRTLRDANVRLLESLAPAEWERVGVHEHDGELTVDTIAARMAAHDRDHLNHIRSALSPS